MRIYCELSVTANFTKEAVTELNNQIPDDANVISIATKHLKDNRVTVTGKYHVERENGESL